MAYASFIPFENNLNELRNLEQETDLNFDSGYIRMVIAPDNENEIVTDNWIINKFIFLF